MPGRQTAFRDIELVDVDAKPGCLEFLIMAGLDWVPVVGPLMMMEIQGVQGVESDDFFDGSILRNYPTEKPERNHKVTSIQYAGLKILFISIFAQTVTILLGKLTRKPPYVYPSEQ